MGDDRRDRRVGCRQHPRLPAPARLRVRGWIGRLRGQLHPYDAGSSVLLGGAFGLLLVILIDTLVGLRHDSLIRALYDATRTTATISAPELADEPWVLVWATIAALLVMGFTAAFAAGSSTTSSQDGTSHSSGVG